MTASIKQPKVATIRNDSSCIRLLSSNSPIPVTMNDVNGQNHHHHNQRSNNNQDSSINAATIEFEDPVKDLLLPDTTEAARCLYSWPNDLPPAVQPYSATVNDPFVLTRSEMDDLARSIRQDLIGVNHPVLDKAAAYFFDTSTMNMGSGGGKKKIRPMMVMMLLSRAMSDATTATATANNNSISSGTTSLSSSGNSSIFGQVHDWQRPDLPAAQRRLAELSEMIHAGTLFHDDVMNDTKDDNDETQQQQQQGQFGNKTAILAGDYFLARSSLSLARLHHTQVSEIMSTSIEHLARGAVMQEIDKTENNWSNSSSSAISTTGDDNDNADHISRQRLEYHLETIFYKTASLMAQTCRSAALLGDYSEKFIDASYRYGKHLGMAVQLVDDIITTTTTTSTATLDDDGPHYRQDHHLMERLARAHAEKAMDAALEISSPENSNNNNNSTVYRDALVHLAYQVAARTS